MLVTPLFYKPCQQDDISYLLISCWSLRLFRTPPFTPLTNNLISCHIVFLLFTLRLRLPFNLFKKKVFLLLEIKRPPAVVIWGSKSSLRCCIFGLADIYNCLPWHRHRTCHGNTEPKDLVFISKMYLCLQKKKEAIGGDGPECVIWLGSSVIGSAYITALCDF